MKVSRLLGILPFRISKLHHQLGWQIVVILLFLNFNAFAESPYWDDFPSSRFYSSPSKRSEVISLDLDPQNILNSSFRIAARENRFDDLQKFLFQGAEINSRSSNGETALMYASRNCSPKTVSLLLKQGAEVNARDFEGRTALMYAAMDSCVSAVELLLKVPEIAFNASDEIRKTAMDYAGDNTLLEVGGPAEKIMSLIRNRKRKGFIKVESRSRPISENQKSRRIDVAS